MVLETLPRALHMLGKYLTTGLHTQVLKEKDIKIPSVLTIVTKRDILSISIGSINIHFLKGTIFWGCDMGKVFVMPA